LNSAIIEELHLRSKRGLRPIQQPSKKLPSLIEIVIDALLAFHIQRTTIPNNTRSTFSFDAKNYKTLATYKG
jgi:hypothetical protein